MSQMQSDATPLPEGEFEYGVHSLHCDSLTAALISKYLPGLQSVQVWGPTSGLYLPGMQAAHDEVFCQVYPNRHRQSDTFVDRTPESENIGHILQSEALLLAGTGL